MIPAPNPDPKHVRELIALTGCSYRGIANRLDLSPRVVRYWAADNTAHPIPYTAQIALENLVRQIIRDRLPKPPITEAMFP